MNALSERKRKGKNLNSCDLIKVIDFEETSNSEGVVVLKPGTKYVYSDIKQDLEDL